MKFNKIIAALLSVLMLFSAFTVVMSAEETESAIEYEYNTSNVEPTIDYFTGKEITSISEDGKVTLGEKVIYTKEDKLEYMDLRFEQPEADGYQLYVDAYSGEVAVRNKATGEVLFTNPYTVGNSTATDSIKEQLLSQLAVKFIDVSTGDDETYYSYAWAAARGQVVVRNIKNGVRVEYTIGREEARMLVPRVIEKSAFEKKVMEPIKAGASEFQFNKFMSYYTLQDPEAETSQTLKDEMYKSFPITKKMAVYVMDESASSAEIATVEGIIKTFAPDYTYEELDEDHMLTEYESEDKNPPLFKMALEYTVDEQGMVVRLPANGIRFNEALYQLYSIEILPYMGAGANSNTEGNFSENNSGYTFFPDGSGTLFDFEKITDLGASTTVTGKVYGQDYAYHTISGTHQEIIRYPVFGLVEKEDLTALQKPVEEGTEGEGTATAEEAPEIETDMRGFVAIVEEGDALMELSSYHAVRTSEYNTVRMIVYPRPQDTYNVADAISVGSNDTWTVVSSRKYTGNYKVRYIMLTDEEVSKDVSEKSFYDCSYVGMAKAYREYLVAKGVLTKLNPDEIGEDIPLYIEAFGALETTERFLSIPIDVMTPLTTFQDITQMYKDLSAEGVDITNVNFILTGFTKGGITDPQVPYYLNWEGAVSKEMSYEELLADANGKYGVYPDFDFAYVKGDGMFDGLSLKKHAVKTIDNRYSSKREYSATKQTYISYYDLALSPAYFSNFYNKLTKAYNDNYGRGGISVSTLGNALNSDFDEDEPYNREDSKKFTVEALAHISNSFDSVLTSGGNAYTWKYVDHITDVALDSSRYSQSAASVPFLGMVLHGYVEFAGTPINMEGNIEYAVLKALENGASLKFILSYRNTNNLKNYEDLSQYYSVRYDIWFEDVVSLYKELNGALSGVQTELIDHHEFISGIRVPDDDELINNAKDLIEANNRAEKEYLAAIDEMTTDNYRTARLEIYRIVAEILSEFDSANTASEYGAAKNTYESRRDELKAIETAIKDREAIYDNNIVSKQAAYDTSKAAYDTAKAAYDTAKAAYDALPAAPTDGSADPNETERAEKLAAMNTAEAAMKKAENTMNSDLKKLDTAKEQKASIYPEDVHTIVTDYLTKLTLLEESATAVLNSFSKLCYEYSLAKGAYLDLVKNDPTLDAAYKAKAEAELAKIDAALAAELEDLQGRITTVNGEVAEAYAAVNAAIDKYQKVDENDTHATKLFDANTFAKVDCVYAYETPVYEDALGNVEDIVKETFELPVYESDTNKIVYERYTDGTAFLLNFNNYKVIVEVEHNGVVHSYSLDAYGYIVLPKQENK